MTIAEQIVLDTPIPLSTVVDVEIVYCPWCGKNVRKWYSKNVDELSRDGLKIEFGADEEK